MRNGLVSAVLLLLCGAILVLFTDIEMSAMRWFSCGPLAPQNERHTVLCR